MPAHTHETASFGSRRFGTSVGDLQYGYYNDGYASYTESTGGDAAHNNMPPYLAVYAWKRTA